MQIIKSKSFTGKFAWDALDIEQFDNATVRLHWTNQPYKWHINDGPEVFIVMDGEVNMHIRQNGSEKIHKLAVGDIFHAQDGDEHVAHPIGQVRALIIEKSGSI